MLERLITPKLCSEVIAMLLEKRGWSISRIARTISAPAEFVQRVQAAKQSLQMEDLEALAKACRQTAHLLVFQSIPADKLSPELQSLYKSTQRVIDSGNAFKRALRRTPSKKKST